MATQRAIVKATIASLVQARNMFTADVTEAGGDTAVDMWHVYLEAFYNDFLDQIHTNWVAYSVELQNLVGDQWVTFDEHAETWAGEATGDPLPNSVAYVLIGKALGVRKMGRKFLGVVPEVSNVGSMVATGVMAILADALLDYISPVTGIGGGILEPGIVDKLGTFHPFIGGMVSSLLGSMRRRKPGIGM
jgi:hypothetical protein